MNILSFYVIASFYQKNCRRSHPEQKTLVEHKHLFEQ
jgi:hypothetical protein